MSQHCYVLDLDFNPYSTDRCYGVKGAPTEIDKQGVSC